MRSRWARGCANLSRWPSWSRAVCGTSQICWRELAAYSTSSRSPGSSGLRDRPSTSVRRARKLLAIPWGGDFRYPAPQFSEGETTPGLVEVLAAIGLQGPWGTLGFLTTADAELQGETPLEWLKHHPPKLEPLLRLARAQGEPGA